MVTRKETTRTMGMVILDRESDGGRDRGAGRWMATTMTMTVGRGMATRMTMTVGRVMSTTSVMTVGRGMAMAATTTMTVVNSKGIVMEKTRNNGMVKAKERPRKGPIHCQFTRSTSPVISAYFSSSSYFPYHKNIPNLHNTNIYYLLALVRINLHLTFSITLCS
jgi:hypothetical protein